jgi:hypothetical protein
MISSRLSRTTALTAFAVSTVIGLSTAAVWADDDNDNHGAAVSAVATSNTKTSDDADSHGDKVSAVAQSNDRDDAAVLARLANAITFAGLTPVTTNMTTYLRITNAGADAGTTTVVLHAADTGAELGTWTSASIPSHGSIQVDLADVAAHATPALTTAQAGAAVDLHTTATFPGSIQAVQWNAKAGSLTNVGACGAQRHHLIGYAEGALTSNVTGTVRLVNASAATAHGVLTLYDAVAGTSLGVWTSADIPAGGSLTVSVATIAAAATPVVAPAAAYTITATGGVRLEHVAVSGTDAVVADLSNACPLINPSAISNEDHDD